MRRPNWSHPLPNPLVIPDVAKLRTLADVRTPIGKHLPKETRAKSTWQHVEAELDNAAARTTQVSIALQMVLQLERVEHQKG
jgi:hypothetical protein